MDFTKIEVFDLVVFFGLFGMFILGFVQGIVRRVIGIASMLFSLVLAAQLHDPVGNYLASQWTDQPPEYCRMVAFGAVFIAGVVASTIGIQWFYKSVPLVPAYPIVEEIVGGLLGLFQGVIVLTALFLILDPFYKLGSSPTPSEMTFLRTFHDWIDGSLTATVMRDNVIPNVLAVFGGLFPEEVRRPFQR